jgi:hypothetical protein
VVRRLGHDRWKQENNGWNDLTQNWAFKHGFLHACQHRPQIESEDGERRMVVNRGFGRRRTHPFTGIYAGFHSLPL